MIRRRLKASVAPLVLLTLAIYLGWQSTQGDRGLWSMPARETRLAEARLDLARAEAELAAWERKVAALRGPIFDRDTLDERARAVLNLADPREIVAPLNPSR